MGFLLIIICFLQVGRTRGKRPRITSGDQESSIEVTPIVVHTAGPSSPKKWPQPGVPLSSDSSDDERNLVSFADIMDAAERAVDDFEGDRLSWNRGLGPWFSLFSSETEYSSAKELSNSSSSPPFEAICDCYHNGKVYSREVIILSSDSDEEEDVQIIE